MRIISQPQVQVAFESYPIEIKSKLTHLRRLILETASDIDSIDEIEETLKWGEPSYLVKNGSTIRLGWKPSIPNKYGLYFNCNSSLVPTFKILFNKFFRYEKNRAIIFDISENVPEQKLKECIELALRYHKLKKLPLLGK